MTPIKLKQAVILAGGLGVRLRPLTNNVPKPMVKVNERPFLEHLFELLKSNGISEVVLLLGYLPEKFINYFGDGSGFGLKIKYSIGDVDWESGTRIKKARHLFDDQFLLMYGDIYWPLNLKRIMDSYNKMGLPAMMTVYNNYKKDGEYKINNVDINENSIITYYGNCMDKIGFSGLDIGFFILKKDVLKRMPNDNFNFQNGYLPKLISKRQLAAYITNEQYCTITNIDFFKKAEVFLKKINKKLPKKDS